jgi:hypothetical protein
LVARNSEIGTMYTSDRKDAQNNYLYRNQGLAKFLAAVLVGYSHSDGADAVMFSNENSVKVAHFLEFQEITAAENQETHQIADPLLQLCLTDCLHYSNLPAGNICCDRIMIKKVRK